MSFTKRDKLNLAELDVQSFVTELVDWKQKKIVGYGTLAGQTHLKNQCPTTNFPT